MRTLKVVFTGMLALLLAAPAGAEQAAVNVKSPSYYGIGGFRDLITPEAMDTLHFRFGVHVLDDEFDAEFKAVEEFGEDELDVSIDRASYELWAGVGILGVAEIGVRVPIQSVDISAGVFEDSHEDLGDVELAAKLGYSWELFGLGGYARGELPTGDEDEGIGGDAQIEVGATAAIYPVPDILGVHGNVAFLFQEGDSRGDLEKIFGDSEVFTYRVGVSVSPIDLLRFVAYWEGQVYEGDVGHVGWFQGGIQAVVGPFTLEVGGGTLIDTEGYEDQGFDDVEVKQLWGGIGLAF